MIRIMISKSNFNLWLIALVMFPLVGLLLSLTLGHAFAQEPSTFMVDRRVEIWALFYRGMVAGLRCGGIGTRKYYLCCLEV